MRFQEKRENAMFLIRLRHRYICSGHIHIPPGTYIAKGMDDRGAVIICGMYGELIRRDAFEVLGELTEEEVSTLDCGPAKCVECGSGVGVRFCEVCQDWHCRDCWPGLFESLCSTCSSIKEHVD